jgi:hypothetical protein
VLQTTFKKVVFVKGDVLVGVVDGSNQTFTTSFNFKAGSMTLYLNGLQQREGSGFDYIVGSLNTIVMEHAPLPGDVLVADYTRL